LSRHPSALLPEAQENKWQTNCVAIGDSDSQKQQNLHFSICACHPCAGAMLIFSVSFEFKRMIPEGNPIPSNTALDRVLILRPTQESSDDSECQPDLGNYNKFILACCFHAYFIVAHGELKPSQP
jgi:hypothetical protein